MIYDAVEGYVQWTERKKEEDQKNALQNVTMPAKIKALKGNFFRRNDPAVFGVEILGGRLHAKVRLMNQGGEEIGVVEQIQENGKNIPEARKGMQVAISVKGPTLGRTIKEDEDLYTYPTSADAKILKGKYAATLTPDDQECPRGDYRDPFRQGPALRLLEIADLRARLSVPERHASR